MGGGGVLRAVKFCKYLPQFNWQPWVLSVKEHDTTATDYTFFDALSETRIYYTFSIDLPIIYKKLTKKNMSTQDKPAGGDKKSKFELSNRFKKFIDNYILIPDSRVGWIPFALYEGIKICKREKIDLIFSTGGPWTNHLIGMGLKKLLKLPWIADFRDHWTTNPFAYYTSQNRKFVEECLERKILQKADKIVTTTCSIANELNQKYEDIEKEKFVLIRNGFDREDFVGVKTKRKDGFNIIHAGNFYAKRTPKFFLQALKSLLSENRLPDSALNVNFIGEVNDETKKIIHSLRLEKVVKCSGSVPHTDSIKSMIGSDVLLLIIGTEESECPGKIFEYLAAKKPILSLSGKGELSSILSEFDHVTIVGLDDINKIKSAIHDLYLKKNSSQLNIDFSVNPIRKFDRKELTNQLASLFDRCV
jgi:glycosyltransferase involved in cell wall biosynthesis